MKNFSRLADVRRGLGSKLADGSLKYLNRMGIQSYPFEGIEEEANIIFNSLLVGDNKFSDLWDGETQADIWGGMFFSAGLMQALPFAASVGADIAYSGRKAKAYHKIENAMNAANDVAAVELGENWPGLKDFIDESTNDQIPYVLSDILRSDIYTDVEKQAVGDYIKQLLIYRGFNQGTAAQAREAMEQPVEEEVLNEPFVGRPEQVRLHVGGQLDNAYMGGYSASEERQNEIRNAFEFQKQALKEKTGLDSVSPEDAMLYFESSDWSPEQKQAVLDYMMAAEAKDGMLQSIRDDIYRKVVAANVAVDRNTSKTDGMVHSVTMKDDRRAYIVDGTAVMTEDGTMVDHTKSMHDLLLRDADTGELFFASIDQILSVDEALDPVAEKQVVTEQIRQSIAQDAANRIDGILPFNPGDQYELTTEQGATFPIQIVANEQGIVDNGDGTVNVVLNPQQGQPMTISQMSKDQIQAMVDATRLGKITAYAQELEGARAARQRLAEEPAAPAEAPAGPVEAPEAAAQVEEQPLVPIDDKGRKQYMQAPKEATYDDIYSDEDFADARSEDIWSIL